MRYGVSEGTRRVSLTGFDKAIWSATHSSMCVMGVSAEEVELFWLAVGLNMCFWVETIHGLWCDIVG